MRSEPAWQAWIERARACDVATAAEAVGFVPKRGGVTPTERCGPCPACGGDDRFSFNPSKNIWNCRKCGGGKGGLSLIMHCNGGDFLAAVEALAGPRPGAGEQRRDTTEWAATLGRSAFRAGLTEAANPYVADDERDLARAWRDGFDAMRKQEDAQIAYREEERERLYRIWRDAESETIAPLHRYLAHRGVDTSYLPGLCRRLRLSRRHPYWGGADHRTLIYKGPAMLAPIIRPDGRFGGLHQTWIDGTFETGVGEVATAGGKAQIRDGDVLCDAKKVRGHKKGGHIVLAAPATFKRLVIGEGIETTLTVAAAWAKHRPDLFAETAFWSGVDLGNIGGPAAGRVAHPTLTTTVRRANGATFERRVKILDGVPAERPDWPAIPVPDCVIDLVLLGDGDSDRLTTETTLQRAARRYARPGRRTRIAFADDAADFNDMVRSAA